MQKGSSSRDKRCYTGTGMMLKKKARKRVTNMIKNTRVWITVRARMPETMTAER